MAALERRSPPRRAARDTLAAQARAARFALARRDPRGRRAPGPKIQLVVALLLVPSVLLLVAAALASALLDGGATPWRPASRDRWGRWNEGARSPALRA